MKNYFYKEKKSKKMSSSPYNTLLSSIQSLSQGKTLTSEQKAYLSDLNTAVANYPVLSKTTKTIQNTSLASVTKRYLETGNFTMSGNVTFSGTQHFTGSVSLATQVQLQATQVSFKNQLNEVHGASIADMSTATELLVPLNPTNDGSVLSTYQVFNASSNYNIAFTGTPDIGTVRRYTIVTNYYSNQCVAVTYTFTTVSGGIPTTTVQIPFTSTPLNTTPTSSPKFAVQEITVLYLPTTTSPSPTYTVFATVTYF